jgi:hypothetical protein
MEAIEFKKLVSLSNSVKVLLDKLVSNVFVDFLRSKMLDNLLLDKLKIRLMRLQAILNYAMARQFANRAVMKWYDKLSYDVFEVETLFDKINTESLLQCIGKAEFETITPTSSHVVINLSSPYTQLVVNSKMKKLIDRLKCLSADKFGFSNHYWIGNPTSSNLANESFMLVLSLSTSVKVLLDRLVSSEFVDNFQTITKLDVSLLENLKLTLLDLHQAEKKLTVGLWLDMLRNVVFEVGYLFDEINNEAEYRTQTATSQVMKIHSSPFKRFNGVTNSKFQKLIDVLFWMMNLLFMEETVTWRNLNIFCCLVMVIVK